VLEEDAIALLDALALGELAPGPGVVPTFSWPMITGPPATDCLYILTSVPQMPVTSVFISAPSSGMSGIGNSRISVLLGPTFTADSTFSATDSSEDSIPFRRQTDSVLSRPRAR
jgi:hypothetical protein